MCVATGPPIKGDPISQSQSHIPLKPLPPALDPFPFPFMRKNQPLVLRSNFGAQEPTPGSAVEHCRFLDTGGGGYFTPIGIIHQNYL